MDSDDKRAGEQPPLVSPVNIVERAESEAARLKQLPRWKAAFVDATQDAPLLVRRLDRTGEFYYLATFRMPQGVSARLQINGHTGRLAEAIAIDKSGDKLQRFLSPDDVRRRIGRQSAGRTKKGGSHPPGPYVMIEPFLVWKPCAQSFSPFQPFYIAQVRKATRFVRVDGQIFNELTPGAGL